LKATVIVELRGRLDHDLEHYKLIEAYHIIFEKTVEPSSEKGLKTVVAKAIRLLIDLVDSGTTQVSSSPSRNATAWSR
jgi:hypothetical protein